MVVKECQHGKAAAQQWATHFFVPCLEAVRDVPSNIMVSLEWAGRCNIEFLKNWKIGLIWELAYDLKEMPQMTSASAQLLISSLHGKRGPGQSRGDREGAEIASPSPWGAAYSFLQL